LLLDVYREQVSRDLAQRHDRDTRERDLLRIAAAAAAKTLTVSYPRVNVDQARPRVPSFYALEVLRAAEGRLPDLREFEKRAAAACAARLDWPAPANPSQAIDNAEYDLAWLRAANNASGSGRYLIEQSAALAASLRTRWKRWERKWADSDGIVGPDAATTAALARHRLRARSYSPSSLQQFAACPYKFLLYAVLGVRPREESVALEQMDPLTRGALFHSAQFEFLGEVKRRKLLPVPEGRLDDLLEISDAVLDRVAAEQAEKLAPAIPRVWENEIEDIRTDLRGWVRHLAAERDWIPDRFEYAFGLKDHTDHRDPTSTTQEAVILDGIRVRGSIDLVERRSNGDALRITDHKTGKRPENPPVYVGGGAYLQPVLYALAAEQLLKENVESSRLFFCTQRGDYADYRVPVNAEARLRISQVMSAIDQAVENGFLPAAPAKGACAICDYAPICGPYEEQRTARKPKDRLEPLTTIRGLP
jgi:CRISPR/Cas system-associated exonuclease Cas4 (RecB family)